ncbi:uncharacterized protein LOC128235770 [Mya arenaria]|uniref:uncharacterized protein LOC128235770 n=1 Tax=Mya arenaria TaxID=6604 RepID=UPI0022DE9FDE|nr:uncharacterized protein LOC128235770 [Mya arenaria]
MFLGQNNELQERSPSDDSQQGYQSPNAVTSNTDRQLRLRQNDKLQLRSPIKHCQQWYHINTQLNWPNDEMVRSSSGDECDDGQLGYQSLVVLQPHPDIHQSGKN